MSIESRSRPSAAPSTPWSKKRLRQYGHIKQGLLDSGRDAEEAEEIAARTVIEEQLERKPAR